jgi:hypothetical protein
MATKLEFAKAYSVKTVTENDTEIIAQKIVGAYAGNGWRNAIALGLAAVREVQNPIYALGLLTSDGQLFCTRDNIRPLYYFRVDEMGLEGFASTRDITNRAATHRTVVFKYQPNVIEEFGL